VRELDSPASWRIQQGGPSLCTPRAGVAKAELEHAIEGHVVTIAEPVGTYER
jgi:hypothetical protein